MTELPSITLTTLQALALRLSYAANGRETPQWRTGYHRALVELLEAADGIRANEQPEDRP
jgi:hypothetical protein